MLLNAGLLKLSPVENKKFLSPCRLRGPGRDARRLAGQAQAAVMPSLSARPDSRPSLHHAAALRPILLLIYERQKTLLCIFGLFLRNKFFAARMCAAKPRIKQEFSLPQG
ncbi:hypothetical protein [uncultured Desulfovibrio sp.]|uniref:hypothetical protein n=1 Tax=uncultured Desulfovibrio sp. TaxID=167968 RepID=UPI00260DCFD5|nr:hypothetical protein [uncultured Desulfovibrio sp.]